MSAVLSRRRVADSRLPMKERVAKLEERLDETQRQVFEIAASQKRTENLLSDVSSRISAVSASVESKFGEIQVLLGALQSRLSQFFNLQENEDKRCKDCPLRPRPAGDLGGVFQ
jgi:hypothetical protein